jgi:hypothetical protein
MIWLTWRQFRTNAWVALVALTALTVAYLVSGPHIFQAYTDSGLASCKGACDAQINQFKADLDVRSVEGLYYLGIGIMFVVPAIVGVFWGAPLVARELETGTYRLAWNQSVTRTRWFAVKLLGLGTVAMGTAGLFSLAVTWWASPLDRVTAARMLPQAFAARGIVPIGYAAFAFVVGVAAGVVVRRTVPAMAITLAIVVFAQVAIPLWVRPHLATPVTVISSLDTSKINELGMSDNGAKMTVLAQADQPNAWILSNRTITEDGTLFVGPANTQACNRNSSPQECMRWVASLGLRQEVRYQPESRFWTLQWRETGIFLVLAGLLAAFCFLWLRPRRT